jgi:hypothetical protein
MPRSELNNPWLDARARPGHPLRDFSRRKLCDDGPGWSYGEQIVEPVSNVRRRAIRAAIQDRVLDDNLFDPLERTPLQHTSAMKLLAEIQQTNKSRFRADPDRPQILPD